MVRLTDAPAGMRTNYVNFVISATVTEALSSMAVAAAGNAPRHYASTAELLVHSDLQPISATLNRYPGYGDGYGTAAVLSIPRARTGAVVFPGAAYISGGLFLEGLSEPATAVEAQAGVGVVADPSNFYVSSGNLDIALRDTAAARSATATPDTTLTVRIADSAAAAKQQTYTVVWTDPPVTFPQPYVYMAESTASGSDPRIVADTGPSVGSEGRTYAFPVAFTAIGTSAVCDCSGVSGASASVTLPAGDVPGLGNVTLSLPEAAYQSLVKGSWYNVVLTTAYIPTGDATLVLADAALVLRSAESPVVSNAALHVQAVDGSVRVQHGISREDVKVRLREFPDASPHMTNFIPNDAISSLRSDNNYFCDFSPATSANKGVAVGSLRTYEAVIVTPGGLFAFPTDAGNAVTYQISILPEMLGNSSRSTWSALQQAGLTAGPQPLAFYSTSAGFIGNVLSVSGTDYVNGAGVTGAVADIVAIATTGPADTNWQESDAAKFCVVVMSGVAAVDAATGQAAATSPPILVQAGMYSVWLTDASAVSAASIDNAGGTGGHSGYLAYEFPDCLRLDLLALSFGDGSASDASSSTKRYVYVLQCAAAGGSDPLPPSTVWHDISSNINWSLDGSTYLDYSSVGASWDDLRLALLGGDSGSGLPERNVTQLQDRDYGADQANCLVYRLLLQTQPRFDPRLQGMNLVASNLYRVATSQFRAFYDPLTNITTSDQYKDYRIPNRVPFYRQTILDSGAFDSTAPYTSTAVWTLASYDVSTGVRSSVRRLELLTFITAVPGLLVG